MQFAFVKTLWLQAFGIHFLNTLILFFIDRCAYIKDRDYEASENCRAYWECSNGHSRGKCCRYGYRYVRGEGCALDSDNICKESCPMEMPTDLHSYNNGKCLELNDHVSNKSILIQNIRKIINICLLILK